MPGTPQCLFTLTRLYNWQIYLLQHHLPMSVCEGKSREELSTELMSPPEIVPLPQTGLCPSRWQNIGSSGIVRQAVTYERGMISIVMLILLWLNARMISIMDITITTIIKVMMRTTWGRQTVSMCSAKSNSESVKRRAKSLARLLCKRFFCYHHIPIIHTLRIVITLN